MQYEQFYTVSFVYACLKPTKWGVLHAWPLEVVKWDFMTVFKLNDWWLVGIVQPVAGSRCHQSDESKINDLVVNLKAFYRLTHTFARQQSRLSFSAQINRRHRTASRLPPGADWQAADFTAPTQLKEPSQRPAAARLTLTPLFLPLNSRRTEVIENAPPPVHRKCDEESRTDFYLVFFT